MDVDFSAQMEKNLDKVESGKADWRKTVDDFYQGLADRCRALGVRILPFDDPDYPLAFSRIPDMPLVLYCTGDPV